MIEFRRKLYKRGSSFETTVPMPLLFSLDRKKKYNVLFRFDSKKNRWYVDFGETRQEKEAKQMVDERKFICSSGRAGKHVPFIFTRC